MRVRSRSRFSRAISAAWSAGEGSGGTPAATARERAAPVWMDARQFRSIDGEMPTSVATCINGRPLLSSSATASRLNSGANSRLVLVIKHLSRSSKRIKGVHQCEGPSPGRSTCTALGKTAIHVKRDVPGFIGNRMQAALWREAISLVENGVCDAEDVDAVVKASFGRRLAVLGPLENADLIGTDLTLAIHEIIMGHIEDRPGASPYLRQLVEEGRLGVKTGEGFMRWTPERAADLRRTLNRHLRAALGPD